MGLLTKGTPLTWEETKAIAETLRQRAIKQFVFKWPQVKNVTADNRFWGDEAECTLVKFDHENKTVKALLGADDLIHRIEEDPSLVSDVWEPEFSGFMLEGVPGKPYNGVGDCVDAVEANFRRRRTEIDKLLKSDETIMTLGTFPLVGCRDFSYPAYDPDPNSDVCRSIMFPDEAVYQSHPHFRTTAKSINEHRGEKPPVLIPIFRDENTPKPFRDDLAGRKPTDYDREQMKDDYIYMDGVPFGASCCCLQMTTQCESLAQALHICDQLIPISPIIMAISASTPIFRGMLSDYDTRWDALRQGLDDRSTGERGLTPLLIGESPIPCSRCDSVDMYVSDHLKSLNDIPIPYCVEAYNAFLKADVDPNYAASTAHLLIRDPLQVYEEQTKVDDRKTSEFFEDIHLFHWRTVRVKLPPRDGSSGWKVEFRPTEIQATDFQNAAFAVFIFLLTRVIFQKSTEFAIPISKVFDNMKAATQRDAARKGKFWWRTSMAVNSSSDLALMSADEIINGKPDINMPGVASMVEQWIDEQSTITDDQKEKLRKYVSLVRRRANGSSKTTAQWMRDFVRSHPDYRKDSVVPESVAYDMLKTMHDVSFGRTDCPDLAT